MRIFMSLRKLLGIGFMVAGMTAATYAADADDKNASAEVKRVKSAAAGPVGRQAEANTDWKMRAEVLTYSRARGVFAGLELNGAVIKQDEDDTRVLYGKLVPFKTILEGSVAPPAGTHRFVATVSKYASEVKQERGATNSPPAAPPPPSR